MLGLEMNKLNTGLRHKLCGSSIKIFSDVLIDNLLVEATSPRSTARRNFFSSKDKTPEPIELGGRPLIGSQEPSSG